VSVSVQVRCADLAPGSVTVNILLASVTINPLSITTPPTPSLKHQTGSFAYAFPGWPPFALLPAIRLD